RLGSGFMHLAGLLDLRIGGKREFGHRLLALSIRGERYTALESYRPYTSRGPLANPYGDELLQLRLSMPVPRRINL
ncbi:hypothetical protein, partial [Sphingomonas sp.]|uniref:hypothetical protein n=1 Tax=Sphingomonas sp. TaxID=28214 RepID=UPI00258634D7